MKARQTSIIFILLGFLLTPFPYGVYGSGENQNEEREYIEIPKTEPKKFVVRSLKKISPSELLPSTISIFTALELIKRDSFYQYTDQELKHIEECLIHAEVNKKTAQGVECFPKDAAARYYPSTAPFADDRDQIFRDPYGVVEAWIYSNQIGYILIRSFSVDHVWMEQCLSSVLSQLNARGVEKIIIDLRNNGGGNTDSAFTLINFFSPAPDTPILKVHLARDARVLYSTAKKGLYARWKPVILVNTYTASASEIVAHALRSWRARIIGESTWGSTDIKRRYVFKDMLEKANEGAKDIPLGVLRITIGKYYFPDGATAEGGIQPDMVIQDIRYPSREKKGHLIDTILERALGLFGGNPHEKLKQIHVCG